MSGPAPVGIGVICMDSTFTKVPGHIRNRTTFEFPVLYHVVEGATAHRVVVQADPGLIEPFCRAARDLQARGAAAITSGCGFLVLFQRELADAVTVPVFASSLVQLPMVHQMLSADQRVGLLVARQASLTTRHLAAIGAESIPVCVAGMEEQPEFREVMLEGRRTELDVERLEREVLTEVDQLAQANPDLGALLIECTDLVPFAHVIQQRLRVPVFDIVTLTNMVHASLTRRGY
jgi:Asp/Glu/hydantoin racemase